MSKAKVAVAILAFGNLGMASKRSLLSIRNLSPTLIYVMCDSAGKKWTRELTSEFMNCQFVFLQPTTSILAKISLESLDNQGYASFGQERFIRITTLKWTLLHEVLIQSDADWILFTDLDVIWTLRAQKLFDDLPKDSNIAIQDDTPKNRKDPYFCTGIMVWRKNDWSVETVACLESFQVASLRSGILQPDEPTFNKFFESNERRRFLVSILPSSEFVVGHRFFRIFAPGNFPKVAAFHANYVKGERNKLRRIRAFELRLARNPLWVPIYMFEWLIRISRYLERLKLK